ncbi:MAG: serine hydrolase domain-containing protein [Thermoanaerobaculia bacterium]
MPRPAPSCRLLAAVAVALALPALLYASETPSPPVDPDPVATFVRKAMAEQHLPGLALLVARHGRVERAEGFGFANLEHQVPVTAQTVFQSGSIGKQFTATAVMMLVEAGKLRLDDSIAKYLPEAPESWRAVTIEELLSHTAGFGDYGDDFDLRRDYTEDELVRRIAARPLLFPPGTGWKYSNFGYVTLGVLVHRVAGQFYGDFLAERVFRPLGMSSTRVMSEADLVPHRAAGYVWTKEGWKNQEWVSPTLNTTADGALYFDVLDLARWDAALYGERLLPRSRLERMWTVTKLRDGSPNSGRYGFGWFRDERDGHLVVEHEGEWQGFTAHIARYLEDRLTIAVLTNLGGADPKSIAAGVAKILLAAP